MPNVQPKAVAGIALGFPLAHGIGLLHGSLKARDILFAGDYWIQIADFNPISLEMDALEPFSGGNVGADAEHFCLWVSCL
jgi:hypothetical protein